MRAAITLKLCSFMETGAIVAAHTTSIPEAPRLDAQLGLPLLLAARRLFCRRRAEPARRDADRWNPTSTTSPPSRPTRAEMRPVHGIVPFTPLDERIAPDLQGFLGHGPVRVGNQAAEPDPERRLWQRRARGGADVRRRAAAEDGRRSAVSSCSRRWANARSRVAFEPDAGLWEYRTRSHAHTYSATLCWAACDRLASIARRLNLADRARRWRRAPRPLRERILAEAWDEKQGALTGALRRARRSTPASFWSPSSACCRRPIRASSRAAKRSAAT